MTSPPTTDVAPWVTSVARVVAMLRDRVLPPGRSALIALAVGVTWAAAMAYLPRHGWYPSVGIFQYQSLGVVVTGVLLVRDRFPRLTLLLVAVFYPDVGLVGMRERAASCGGTLEIGRSGLGGWLVRARLGMAVPGEASPAGPQPLPQAG